MSFRSSLRRRLLPSAMFFLLVWPLGSGLLGALAIQEQSVANSSSPRLVFLASLIGVLKLAPEFVWVGLMLTIAVASLFALVERAGRHEPPTSAVARLLVWSEPMFFALAFMSGLALEYPAVLRPLFRISFTLTVAELTTGLLLILAATLALVGGYRAKTRGLLAHLAAFALIVLAGWRLPFVPLLGERTPAPRGSIVILGLDSISQVEDLSTLRNFTRERGGVWYEHARTPGLVTNMVWASILMHRLPQQTGVYMIYQGIDWRRVPYSLVDEAERRGFESWSFFSSQFTSYIGSQAGFDHDRSSPLGWLYITTGFTKDASVFLPVVLPRLPRLPFARSEPNQEGTFAYDLRQNIRDVLTADADKRPSFVAAHLDYLHAYGYPRYRDLDRAAAKRVWNAPVGMIQDQSLDPEMKKIEGDPLTLEEWKLQRLQTLLAGEVRSTKFLEHGGRLVIFSDHGKRKKLSEDEHFGRPIHAEVPFATFGLPKRPAGELISLTDIASIIGMPAPGVEQRYAPVTQHVKITNLEAAMLQASMTTQARGSGLRANGEVHLDPMVVHEIGKRLQTCVPSGPNRGYWLTPAADVDWLVGERQ